MNSNLVICRNEVIVEDENVGQFQSFEVTSNRQTLGASAVLTIPLYAIGTSEQTGEARTRVRNVFAPNVIKPCAKIEVFCWYEGEEKLKVFSGFIEHIGEGFPTKLYLQDNTYILRFGQIQKGWNEDATLQKIVKDCIPIAQEAFNKEREIMGLTMKIPELTYSTENKNVQAVTTSLSFRNWGARSPYDTIRKLMQLLVLYSGVSDDYNVFIGAGVEKSTRPIIGLDTRYNVVSRDIVPIDGRFVDYDVKVTGILSNGKQYTATGGYGTTRSRDSRSQFDKTYGESQRYFTILNNVSAIQNFADRMLEKLKGFKNKGTITLLLYPKIELMDWITYNDTLFPELSSGYYVLGYSFKADESGYFQTLQVTDQLYAF